jgi:amidohydrolase
MTELVASVAREVVGNRASIAETSMASDDVAYFLQRAPGCFFFVGTANEARGLIGSNHHPRFDIDEDALPVGVEMLVRVAERYLA